MPKRSTMLKIRRTASREVFMLRIALLVVALVIIVFLVPRLFSASRVSPGAGDEQRGYRQQAGGQGARDRLALPARP